MTFTRLAKIAALVLVAYALWRARPPGTPAKVVVLALPGASAELLRAGDQAQVLAHGPLALPPGTTGSAFWKRLFATEDAATDPADLTAAWSGAGAPIRVLAAPAHVFASDKEWKAGDMFAGSSAGVVVESEDLTAGRLPPPYDRAVDAIVTAAATLGREQWSDWITIAPPAGAAPSAGTAVGGSTGSAASAGAGAGTSIRPAQFQFARFGDSAYFFSPAYVTGHQIVERPFLRGKDRELRPLLAAHMIALSQRELAPSHSLFSQPGESRPIVVFDTVAEDAMAVFSPDLTPASVLDEVRDAITAELSLLREAAGSGSIVMAIGGPGTSRQAGDAGWYSVMEIGHAGSRSDGAPAEPLGFAAARATLRYLTGTANEPTEKAAVPASVLAAVTVHPHAIAGAPAKPPGAAPMADAQAKAAADAKGAADGWTADKIESVPGAVGRGQ